MYNVLRGLRCECLAKTTTAYVEGKISDDVVKEVVTLKKKTYKEELIEKSRDESAVILTKKLNISLEEARKLLDITTSDSALTDMTLQ